MRRKLLGKLRGLVIWLALVGLLAVASVKTDQTTAPVVEINGGLVRGLVRTTVDRHRVNLYQGIRYGRAERFCIATPVKPWTGIYEATVPGNACPQSDLTMPILKQKKLEIMSEDCLFLDVWQPAADSTKNRSVMVWIYGDDFMMGSINQYDLAQFAGQGDVVVVSINYRLGSLAFVNGGTDLEPGNLALYDQILALRWVQHNVDKFGGDPLDVTIFGESGGGWTVGLLALSPLTDGLFHRAILQSAKPYHNLFAETREESLQKTLKFAKSLNCLKEDYDGLNIEQNLAFALNCLRAKPANYLAKFTLENTGITKQLYPYNDDQFSLFSIEKSLQFGPKLMFGVTRGHGVNSILTIFSFENGFSNITLDLARQTILKLVEHLKIPNSNVVMEEYIDFLTQDSDKDSLWRAVLDFIGDNMLICPTILFEQQIPRRMLKNYYFFYRLKVQIVTLPAWMDVAHHYALPSLFNIDTLGESSSEYSKSFKKLSQNMGKVWTRFAKTGDILPISAFYGRKQPEHSSVREFQLHLEEYKTADFCWDLFLTKINNTVSNTSPPPQTERQFTFVAVFFVYFYSCIIIQFNY